MELFSSGDRLQIYIRLLKKHSKLSAPLYQQSAAFFKFQKLILSSSFNAIQTLVMQFSMCKIQIRQSNEMKTYLKLRINWTCKLKSFANLRLSKTNLSFRKPKTEPFN